MHLTVRCLIAECINLFIQTHRCQPRKATASWSGAVRVRASRSGTPRPSARRSRGSNQQPWGYQPTRSTSGLAEKTCKTTLRSQLPSEISHRATQKDGTHQVTSSHSPTFNEGKNPLLQVELRETLPIKSTLSEIQSIVSWVCSQTARNYSAAKWISKTPPPPSYPEHSNLTHEWRDNRFFVRFVSCLLEDCAYCFREKVSIMSLTSSSEVLHWILLLT